MVITLSLEKPEIITTVGRLVRLSEAQGLRTVSPQQVLSSNGNGVDHPSEMLSSALAACRALRAGGAPLGALRGARHYLAPALMSALGEFSARNSHVRVPIKFVVPDAEGWAAGARGLKTANSEQRTPVAAHSTRCLFYTSTLMLIQLKPLLRFLPHFQRGILWREVPGIGLCTRYTYIT